MQGRKGGEVCPECGIPFDDRPEWPFAKRDSLTVLSCGLGSAVMVIAASILSEYEPFFASTLGIAGILLGIQTLAMASWPGPNARTHRVQRKWRYYRIIGQMFAWIVVAIPVAIITISLLYDT